MTPQEIFAAIEEHFDEVIDQSTIMGKRVLEKLKTLHHADIAQFLSSLGKTRFSQLFTLFDREQRLSIFEHLPNSFKAQALSQANDQQRLQYLEHMAMDDIFDLVDFTTEDELKKYFGLLRRKDREKVISLLKLDPESAGAVMDINVVSLNEHLTVARSIQILQRLRPQQELHRIIYITDSSNKLVGYIDLQDLVLKNPQSPISSFMKKNEIIVKINEPQQVVARKMRHYQVTGAPVVGKNDYFLGAITAETLVDILEEEASEDLLRISALPRLKHSYFETPFFKLLLGRGGFLFVLMFIESFSSIILNQYEKLLAGSLMLFIPMLTSTGGNTSTQTSALVVQGFASGELNETNVKKFLRRELLMALFLAVALGTAAFIRVFFLGHQTGLHSIAIAASIGVVVMTSVSLGSGVPFILKRIGIDPALAAAPFLATGMDILGILLYCVVSSAILSL